LLLCISGRTVSKCSLNVSQCSPMFSKCLPQFSKCCPTVLRSSPNVRQMFSKCSTHVIVMSGLCCIPLLVCMWPGKHCRWRTKPGIHSTQTVSASTPLARCCERNAASDRMQLLNCTSQRHLPGRSFRNAVYILLGCSHS
jgi:hypothetical protein